jgi:hypothetical protein
VQDHFAINPPEIREWQRAIGTSWWSKLSILLKNVQDSWIFAGKAQP